MTFDGRHVVITGGNGALGRAVVQSFVAAGATCHLPLLGAAPDPAEPGVSRTGHVDLSSESAVGAWYAGLPPIWASIHLAGGYQARAFLETSLADLQRQLDLNLVTTFLCCREAVRSMGTRGGRIVNVAARVVEVPVGGAAAYSVSKAGVAALTRALAIEGRAAGILVNAVLPSIIDSPANREAMPKSDHSRWPKPGELAGTIRWLASPENILTSGALVPVYGAA